MPESGALSTRENHRMSGSPEMKVLFISHVSLGEDLYGAAQSLVYLIEGLQEKGVKCFVILPGDGSQLERMNPPVKYMTLPYNMWAKDQRNLLKRVLNTASHFIFSPIVAVYAIQWQVDIIYTNSIMTPIGALAAGLLGKPHVLHVREFGWEDFRFRFDLGEAFSARLMSNLSKRVIMISKALEKKYSHYINPNKMDVIYNPVHISNGHLQRKSSENIGKDQNHVPKLVIVGRIHPSKGQEDAISAVNELIQRDIGVSLDIVGSGEDQHINELEHMIRKHNLQQYVHLTGYVDDPERIMKAADICLVCSRSEAFGRVTAEAMIAKTSIVGARTGATPELIRENKDGLLYDYGDPVDLANKIEYILENPEEAARMRENGFKRATSEFTLDQYISGVYDILKDISK